MRVGPEHELLVALRARKPDAFLDQAPAEPGTAGGRLDEQQAQARLALVVHHEHAADALAVALRDPAALALRIEVLEEVLDDSGAQRLELRTPSVLLVVEHRVAIDHPAHVAGAVLAQRDLAG